MRPVEEVKERMQAYLEARFPERQDLKIEEMQRNSALGFSYEIYLFKLAWRENGSALSQDLVIRMEPDEGLVPPYDIRPQYEVLIRLQSTGLPIPRVHWLEMDSDVLGHPFFVMDKVQGDNFLGVWHTRPEQRKEMEKDYITLLHKLHELDCRALDLCVLGMPSDDREYARSQIARWEQVTLDHQHYPQPLMAELIAWAKRNIPRSKRTTLCHGDYHGANCHYNNGRIVAIFDWELVGLGDPISDIGWACLLTDIHCWWNEDEVVRSYEELSGEKIDEQSLLFWKVLAHIKLAAVLMAGIKVGIYSEIPSPYMALPLIVILPKVLDNGARLLGI